MKLTILITTIITLLVISSAQAEKWAILVGIDDYENEDINDLKCAVADVTVFNKTLVEVGEFEPDNIFLMTDKSTGEKRPTNTNILYKVGTLAKLMKSQDMFIFYFSGHGMMRGGKAFLLSINADPRSVGTLELSGVPMDKLKEQMNKIKARQVLFIVDACRNDPSAGRGDRDNLLTDDFARIVRVMPGSGNSGVPSATATLYSCSKGERAYEYYEKGQGAFSYFLVQGLRGEAVDSAGNITVNLLADYTQREVAKWGDKVRIEVNLIRIESGEMFSVNTTVGGIPDDVAIEPPKYEVQKKRIDERINDWLPEREDVADKKSNSDFRITIEPDKGNGGLYREGEQLALFVKSDVDCYIEVYNIAADGSTNLVFPNEYWAEYNSSNKIRAGVRQKLPYDDSFTLGIGGPSFGIETLKVIASTEPFEEVSRSIYDSRGAFPDMGNIDDDATLEQLKIRSRNVYVEPGQGTSESAKIAQAQCTIITKP